MGRSHRGWAARWVDHHVGGGVTGRSGGAGLRIQVDHLVGGGDDGRAVADREDGVAAAA